jgi:hypothetical protein
MALVGEVLIKSLLGRPMRRDEYNIKIDEDLESSDRRQH